MSAGHRVAGPNVLLSLPSSWYLVPEPFDIVGVMNAAPSVNATMVNSCGAGVVGSLMAIWMAECSGDGQLSRKQWRSSDDATGGYDRD